MANQLWSDLLIGAGQLWSDLDAAPGIVTPGPAVLTLLGQVPVADQPTTVFRTPAPALLTLSGLTIQPGQIVLPGVGALSIAGLVPAKQTIRTISPALPAPDYNVPSALTPTVLTQMTVSPATAALSIATLPFNLTQGGNIGFISPTTAQLSLQTRQYSLLLLSGGAGVGALQILGLAPTLQIELIITPDVGLLVTGGSPADLALPFNWIDDDPAPAVSWITDSAA